MAKARPEKQLFSSGIFRKSATKEAAPQITGVPSALLNDSMQDLFRLWRRRRKYELLFFHHALQGVLVLAREIHHLRHLGLGDLVGEYAALSNTVMVDVEHDL